MLESLFKFLFKYERLVYDQGQFVLGATRSMWFAAAVAAAVGLYALYTYRQLRDLTGRDRIVLFTTRTAMLLLALFALLRPMLQLKVAVPQQNFVAILLDDSSSMKVVDEQDKARSEFVKDQLGRPDGPLLTALGKRFVPKVFRFSSSAERLQSAADLQFNGSSTRFADALGRVRDEMSGLPVAGVVVVSDGADNAETTMDEAIAGLKAQAMPVFSVGVGKERLTRDVQVTRAEVPRRVLKGSSLVVDVVLTQSGYRGAKVPLIVEDAGRVVSQQDVTLPADGESQTVKVRFKASEVGPRTIRFRCPCRTRKRWRRTISATRSSTSTTAAKRFCSSKAVRPRPCRQARDGRRRQPGGRRLLRTAEATVNAPDKYCGWASERRRLRAGSRRRAGSSTTARSCWARLRPPRSRTSS